MQTKFIIFGADGLLVDSEKLAYRIAAELLRDKGHRLSQQVFAQVQGVDQEQAQSIFAANYPGIDGKKDVYEPFYPRFLKAMAAGELATKPGLFSLLSELDKRGIKRALVSARKAEIVRATLRHIGVYNRFDALVCTEMVKRVKPHPDLFLKAAQMLGGRPQDCLVLENSRTGVLAAVSAEMPVILISGPKPVSKKLKQTCLRCFDSLEPVREFIQADAIAANDQ